MKEKFPGVFLIDGKVATRATFRDWKPFSEQIVKGYRLWDPNRSKPAAAITKGLKTFPVKPGMKILYLGIASGYSSSFFSDIIGPEGIIYGVEISERTFRELNPVAEKRGNIVPILANARRPQDYDWVERVDLVFQDVATDDQSEILIRNCKAFLKKDGFAMLSLKSRSIDVTRQPEAIYKQERAKLDKEMQVVEMVRLDPYEKDHAYFVLKFK